MNINLHSKTYKNDSNGIGNKIIVIHGWSNSISVIEPLSQLLANFSEVISLDLPGHGQSPVPEEIWGMKDFSACLKNFLDQNNIKKANFVGHSFGGKTLIKFTSEYPEYVDKLVLIGASGIRPTPSLKKRFKFLFLKFLRNFIRFGNTRAGQYVYKNWYIPTFASRDYLNAGPMTKTFVKTINEELHSELAQIQNKTLLIWGEDDDESPKEVAHIMNKLIKNSELILIPHQGHYPFLGGGSGLVSMYIKKFLLK